MTLSHNWYVQVTKERSQDSGTDEVSEVLPSNGKTPGTGRKSDLCLHSRVKADV